MRTKRTHDVAPSDTLDRAAFLLAFVLGAGGSLLLKAMGVHLFVPAVFAAVVLALYAFVAWAGGRLKIEPETVGDNCYYLGFLFTLASLAYTLFQVADPSLTGGRVVDIPEVISGFGLALSSTIFGVFLRVWMMQLRSDFVAKDREMRAEINRSFGDFKKNMSGMLSQMKAYATESVQVAAERDARIRRSTERFLKDHQKSLTENANLLSNHMEQAFSEAGQKSVAHIMTAIEESRKAQQEQFDAAIDELQAIRDRLREQETETVQEIQARREGFAAELEETKMLLNAQRAAMDEFQNSLFGMLSQIKDYAAESSMIASRKDEQIQQSIKQFLEDNRNSLKENADYLSIRMTESFSKASRQAANDFSLALRENLKARQIETKGELNERSRSQEAKVVDANQHPRNRVASEPDDSRNLLNSGVAGTVHSRQQVDSGLDGITAHEEKAKINSADSPVVGEHFNDGDLPFDENEDERDPFKQVPWTS